MSTLTSHKSNTSTSRTQLVKMSLRHSSEGDYPQAPQGISQRMGTQDMLTGPSERYIGHGNTTFPSQAVSDPDPDTVRGDLSAAQPTIIPDRTSHTEVEQEADSLQIPGQVLPEAVQTVGSFEVEPYHTRPLAGISVGTGLHASVPAQSMSGRVGYFTHRVLPWNLHDTATSAQARLNLIRICERERRRFEQERYSRLLDSDSNLEDNANNDFDDYDNLLAGGPTVTWGFRGIGRPTYGTTYRSNFTEVRPVVRGVNYDERVKAFTDALELLERSETVGNDCAICKLKFDDATAAEGPAVCLPCHRSHAYHRGCIRPWLEDQANCPHCRAEFAECRRALPVYEIGWNEV